MKAFLICFLVVLHVGCAEKYEATRKVCSDELFLEIYNINPMGVGKCYITDSLNFRILLGKYDEEHESYTIFCDSVSLNIIKIVEGNKSAEWVTVDGVRSLKGNIDTIENKKYNLATLQRLKNYE